jgi:type I restriction enzyme S subunit
MKNQANHTNQINHDLSRSIGSSDNLKPFYSRSLSGTTIPSDWEVKKLSQIATITSGGTPSRIQKTFWGGDIPWITTSLIDFNEIDCAEEYITEEGLKNSSTKLFPKGTLLMALYGQGVTRGKTALLNIEASTNQACAAIILNENIVDNKYVFQYLINKYEDIRNLSNTGNQENLNGELVKSIKLNLPPLPEQRAIAQVLSIMDTTINQNNQLIVQKELRKKWLMQNLLTGKKRLKGFENTKWRIQSLENFVKSIVREVPKPNVPYLGIGLRSHGKGTFLKHDEQPEKNSMDKFYVVRPNDLIVNITFAWEQAIAIVRPEDDGALASHRFPTFTFIEGKGHPNFFRFFILQPRMKFMLELISPGGAGRNRVMSKSDFIKLEFSLPDFKEQAAIAQVLQAADKEIQLLKTKTEKLREQKKGMMQLLLTGKKRLKINTH